MGKDTVYKERVPPRWGLGWRIGVPGKGEPLRSSPFQVGASSGLVDGIERVGVPSAQTARLLPCRPTLHHPPPRLRSPPPELWFNKAERQPFNSLRSTPWRRTSSLSNPNPRLHPAHIFGSIKRNRQSIHQLRSIPVPSCGFSNLQNNRGAPAPAGSREPHQNFGLIKRSHTPSRVSDPIRGDELPVC